MTKIEQAGEIPRSFADEGLEVINGAEVAIKPIPWLWPGKFAKGKVGVIAGDPGMGKSQVTMNIAATVTTGGTWPVTGEVSERGRVLLFSAEDDPSDTIVPRLIAAGGDRAMLDIQRMVRVKDRKGMLTRRFFDLGEDLRLMELYLASHPETKLVIIDPLTAYFPRGVDGNSNAAVRSLLGPLGELVSRFNAALIAVAHQKKGSDTTALNRLNGSIALGALARSAWAVYRDPDNADRRLFLSAKANNERQGTGLAFSIEGRTVQGVKTSRVVWEREPVSMIADDVLTRGAGGSQSRSQRCDEAEAWLKSTLSAKGTMSRPELVALGAEARFAEATIDRAAKRLPIVRGFKPGTNIRTWSLASTAEDAARAHFRSVVAIPAKTGSGLMEFKQKI